MPGLSQLKQFNKDILSIGDEVTLRASRGEKPVRVPIPATVKDVDDSEDFVIGMPENPVVNNESTADEDLSELTGMIAPKKSDSNESAAEPSYEAPDMSSLLSPVDVDTQAGEEIMPDLSMFMDEPAVEEIVQEEPEEEEISVADMSLEALLAGAGFDGSAGTEENEPDTSTDDFDDLGNTNNSVNDDLDNLESLDAVEALDEVEPLDYAEDLNPVETVSPEMDFGGISQSEPEAEKDPFALDIPADLFSADDMEIPTEPSGVSTDDFDLPDLPLSQSTESAAVDDFGATGFVDMPLDFEEPASTTENFDSSDVSDISDFSTDDLLSDIPSFEDEPAAAEDVPELTDQFTGDLDSLGDMDSLTDLNTDFDVPGDSLEDLGSVEELEDIPEADNLDSLDLSDIDASNDFDLSDASEIEMEESDGFVLPSDDFKPAEDFAADVEDIAEPEDNGIEETDFNLGDFTANLPSDDNDSFETPAEDSAENNEESFGESAGLPEGDFSLDDIGSIDFGSDDFGSESFDDAVTDNPDTESDDFSVEATDVPDINADSFDLDATDFGSTDFGSEDTDFSGDFGTDDTSSTDSGSDDFGLPDMGGLDDSFGEALDSPDSGASMLDSVTAEIPDFDDQSFDDASDFGSGDSGDALESFDTTGMEGMDFDLPEQNENSDFEMGQSDDFAMEGSDFEIPGFSDVKIAKDSPKKPVVSNLDEPDFSQGIPGNELPPNTLSDEQYKTFLKNLNEYPLNVRLAFEEFIVQDEFTDDAEFEIIEKILKKAPARQVAATLEKMLDTSIPVPRDYEHRTAEEYEAYKKSLQYQLRNKILPGLIGLIILCFVGWGLYVFGKNCIYRPARASYLYKQGYALLEAEEYPQSEIYFNKATTYGLKKNWFFNYARGYRNHKQYQKSAEMYEKILRVFKHDKAAGLEYAEMEFADLANYERSEEILKREVLDYHVNDVDADLMLGDVYLEWGSEKDSSKLDLAAQQYQKLLMTNGGSDLYNSRMMRYYIRTDNLVAVLNYKERFLNREKSLAGEDWTELSGYLLEKLYGPLSPADEYLRARIEDVKKLLLRAVKYDSSNPISHYNLGNYYVETNDIYSVEGPLNNALQRFNDAERLKRRDIYKYIDTYRLLGENFIKQNNTLRAQEQYTNGITLYTTEKENGGLEGNEKIGLLYADLGDINYFKANDYDNALRNYVNAIDLGYDNSMLRYRVGYVNYRNKKYQEALYSFKKAGEGNIKEKNLLLAMGNTLSLRNDDYGAEASYNQLISRLDDEIAEKGIVLAPQTLEWDNEVVTTYLYAANNYGVTCWNLAKRTGDSSKNRDALVYLERSIKAWDALTRNQNTLVRQEGSNLAQENMKYMTHPVSNYDPAIYIDIPKTLTNNEKL